MAKKLRLTGRASFTHPLTYGIAVMLNQVINVTDEASVTLLALTNRDADPGVPMFTQVSAGTAAHFDFTTDVPVASFDDGSVLVAPEALPTYPHRIRKGILLRGADMLPYGYSNGLGGYDPLVPNLPAMQAMLSRGGGIRSRPVRIGYLGDSTANGATITGSTPFDFRIVTQAIPGTASTLSNNTSADKYLLPAFYPKAWVVANCGISGDSTSQLLAREASSASATRKAITDLLDMAPDVVIVRIGTNDFNSRTAPIAQSVVDTAVSNLTRIVRRVRSAGIPVIVEGIHGYAPPSGASADIAARKSAMLAYNSAAQALCRSDPTRLFYLSPIGLTADSTGTYLPGLYETATGIHLTVAGAVAVAQAEAEVLTALFGAPYGPRFPGTNAIGNAALMNAFTTPSYGVVANGFSVLATNCTRQNAKLEEIDGRMWQTCEYLLTGSSAVAQIFAPFTPSAYGIAVNDVWGFEFDFLLQPVSPSSTMPSPSGLIGSVTLAKTAAGSIFNNALSLSYSGYPFGTTGVIGKAVIGPLTITEASAALSDANSSMRLEYQTNANDGSAFKLGMSLPRAVRLGSDGYPLA